MTPSSTYVRTSFTWLAYLMVGYFSFMESSLGPTLPSLQQQLNLSYAVVSLHFSAFALGIILTGLIGDRVIGRWGRRATIWGGAVGMVVGELLIAVGSTAAITVLGALTIGFLGSLTLVTVQAALSDTYGSRRVVAFSEAAVVASLCSIAAPLIVGFFTASIVGWTGAYWLAMALVALLALVFRRTAVPPTTHHAGEAPRVTFRVLGLPFWAYCAVFFLASAVEWALLAWIPTFLHEVGGMTTTQAATLMSVFFAAMLGGRLLGSVLSRRLNSGMLLLLALGVTLVGFPFFWLAAWLPLRVLGMVITGFGIANQYPFSIANATHVAARYADAANARLALTNGLAGLLAPFALGALADSAGVQQSYAVVAGLLVIAVIMAYVANRVAASAVSVAAS
ncbi:MAG: MFS transporter [Anaerolineae bacterium]